VGRQIPTIFHPYGKVVLLNFSFDGGALKGKTYIEMKNVSTDLLNYYKKLSLTYSSNG
jgi:hypothetical protein